MSNLPLKVSSLNGVKVYNCTAGKTTPEWFDLYKGREGALRYNEEFRRRIELIQDFEFPTSCSVIRVSPDGRYIAAAGTYKPSIRLFELDQLSMKVERYCDAGVAQIQFLTDDFSKFLALREDRTIEIHAQYGLHATVRVPKFGRDMLYHRPTCDAYVCGSGNEVYRLNLEQGSFMAPLETSLPSINAMSFNPVHPIIAFASGDNGMIECWDIRDRTCAAKLDIRKAVSKVDPMAAKEFESHPKGLQMHSLAFDASGLNMAAGTNTGHAMVFDIRAGAPHIVRDHRYGLPIHSISFHDASRKLITVDRKIAKIWDAATGAPHTSIQPEYQVNCMTTVQNSGLLMFGCMSKRIQVYYAPTLGPVPNWCAHLEALTEEMEETEGVSQYDDYRFVSREQLEDWGVTHLIGTNVLRPYMHGFFIDQRLYDKIRVISEPETFQSFVKKQTSKEIEARRDGRISLKSQLPAVNKELAQVLLQQELSSTTKKRKTQSSPEEQGGEETKVNLLKDERFSSLFSDADFEIDPNSPEYQRLHSRPPKAKVVKGLVGISTEAAEAREKLSAGARKLQSTLADISADSRYTLIDTEDEKLGDERVGVDGKYGEKRRAKLEDFDEEDDNDPFSRKRIQRKRRGDDSSDDEETIFASSKVAEAKRMQTPGGRRAAAAAKEKAEMLAKTIETRKMKEAEDRLRLERERKSAREEEEETRSSGALYAVKAGVSLKDVIEAKSRESASYAHLPLAQRLRAEASARRREELEAKAEHAKRSEWQDRDEEEVKRETAAQARRSMFKFGTKVQDMEKIGLLKPLPYPMKKKKKK